MKVYTNKFWILALALLTQIGDTQMNAKNERPQAYVESWPVEDAFQWIGLGELMLYRIEIDRARSADLIYYRNLESGLNLLLNGSIDSFNEVLEQEKPTVDEEFLSRELTKLIVFSEGRRGAMVLSEWYLGQYRGWSGKDEKTEADLVKLYESMDVRIDQKEWFVRFVVIGPAGSAEEWSVNGGLEPLKLQERQVKQLFGRGDLHLMPLN